MTMGSEIRIWLTPYGVEAVDKEVVYGVNPYSREVLLDDVFERVQVGAGFGVCFFLAFEVGILRSEIRKARIRGVMSARSSWTEYRRQEVRIVYAGSLVNHEREATYSRKSNSPMKKNTTQNL